MLRILIISDDPLVRSGLAAILAGQPTLDVSGQMSTALELGQVLEVYAPDAIVWDVGADTGLARDRIAEIGSQIPVLALAQDERDGRSVWGGNVRGILPRKAGAEQIAAALHSISSGLLVLDPSFNSLLSTSRPEDDEHNEPLTARELEVLQLVARGLANKTIAQELAISEHTVKFHINSILAKLGAGSRTDAVVRASRRGLITL
jgi:two-component system, NarL family, nitrate/nitrite response regulator NarL